MYKQTKKNSKFKGLKIENWYGVKKNIEGQQLCKMQQNLVTRDIMLVAMEHASLATSLTLWAPVFYHQIFGCRGTWVPKYFIMSPDIAAQLVITPRNVHEMMQEYIKREHVYALCINITQMWWYIWRSVNRNTTCSKTVIIKYIKISKIIQITYLFQIKVVITKLWLCGTENRNSSLSVKV